PGNIKQRHPGGAEQELVGVRRERVYRASLDVETERAQALNRVDDEQNVAIAAVTSDRDQVVAKPAGEFDEAQGDDAGAVVDQRQNLFGIKAAIAFARHSHLDAEFAFDPHPRDDVGREFAIGGDYGVAFAPID